MKSINEWRTDSEYVSIVSDLLAQPAEVSSVYTTPSLEPSPTFDCGFIR